MQGKQKAFDKVRFAKLRYSNLLTDMLSPFIRHTQRNQLPIINEEANTQAQPG